MEISKYFENSKKYDRFSDKDLEYYYKSIKEIYESVETEVAFRILRPTLPKLLPNEKKITQIYRPNKEQDIETI